MSTTDCGTCREDYPDRGQPPNMWSVSEGDCLLDRRCVRCGILTGIGAKTVWARDDWRAICQVCRKKEGPLRSLLERAEGGGIEVGFLARDGDWACAAMTLGLLRQTCYDTRRNLLEVEITEPGRELLEALRARDSLQVRCHVPNTDGLAGIVGQRPRDETDAEIGEVLEGLWRGITHDEAYARTKAAWASFMRLGGGCISERTTSRTRRRLRSSRSTRRTREHQRASSRRTS